MARQPPLIVGENDNFTRVVQIVMDPTPRLELQAAYADYLSADVPDFAGWRDRVRDEIGAAFPAEVRLVDTDEELLAAAPDAAAIIVEALEIDARVLDLAPRLKCVQRNGVLLRNIEAAACAARGVKVLTVRRRSNIGVAETAVLMMLMLAKKTHQLAGVISANQLSAAGYPYRPLDRPRVPSANYGRVGGIKTLYGATVGIIGMGEIGREIALRLKPFDARVLYHQRRRLADADEAALGLAYAGLGELLAASDFVVPQLPLTDSTRGILGARELGQMKRGALLVNVARAELVQRGPLLEALRSGQLGGFALDPLYKEPGDDDEELLGFGNVILTPHVAAQPRTNLLADIEDIIKGVAREII